MADELIDICDEENNLLGIQKMKSEAHKKGLWHRVAHIWFYNSNGEVLIQLRAKEKLLYPDMWDISVAGHIGAGETPIKGALREIKEEVGLRLKEDDLSFWKIKKDKVVFRNIKNNEFCYIYFFRYDGDINLKLQKEEVQKIEFKPINTIKKKLKTKNHKYVPHGSYWLEVLDEIEKKLI